MHCTTKDSTVFVPKHRNKPLKDSDTHKISKHHPFHGLETGQELTNLTVVSTQKRNQITQVILTDIDSTSSKGSVPMNAVRSTQIHTGSVARAVVVGYAKDNKGLVVQVNPSLRGFVPGLELTKDLDILSSLKENVPCGAVLECAVLDEEQWCKNRLSCPLPPYYKKKLQNGLKKEKTKNASQILSLLARNIGSSELKKPSEGELIIGMINRHIPQVHAPSLMLETRGGYLVRADITELDEPDEWTNMPLGNSIGTSGKKATETQVKEKHADNVGDDSDSEDEEENEPNER